jgi:hypothetical protein
MQELPPSRQRNQAIKRAQANLRRNLLGAEK